MTRVGPRPSARHRSRLAAAAVPGVLAAILTGCAGAVAAAPASPSPTTPAPAPTAVIDVPVVSSELGPAAQAVAPVRVLIDVVGVDMPVEPVGVDPSRQMALPQSPATAGWYRFGADAVAQAGNTVLAAHVDLPQYDVGPFSRLRDLSPGASVAVVDERGATRTYQVESVTFYEKVALPVDEIFSRDGAHALIMITCGGPYDWSVGRYRDNVVVVARPA